MSDGVKLDIRADIKRAQKKLSHMRSSLVKDKLLRLIGFTLSEWAAKNFREQGIERKWPRLSENTLAGKKGSTPLYGRGGIRRSFGFAVYPSYVRVYNSDKKASWHHAGTRPYTIEPVAKKTLAFMTVNGLTFAGKVDHPGLPERPLLPSKKLGKQLAAAAVDKYIKQEVAKAHGAR